MLSSEKRVHSRVLSLKREKLTAEVCANSKLKLVDVQKERMGRERGGGWKRQRGSQLNQKKTQDRDFLQKKHFVQKKPFQAAPEVIVYMY